MAARIAPPRIADRHLEVGSFSDWKVIRQPQLNLVSFKRVVPAPLLHWLDGVLGTLRVQLSLQVPARAFPEAALLSALPNHDGSLLLLDDLHGLWRSYRALMRPQAIHLKLNTVCSQMCPKFHADRVRLRLLCTYGGPGTLWVPESALSRGAHGPRVLEEGALRQLGRFEIGLLKGEAWPGNRALGAVHRSPPLGAGSRLLFSLDAIGGHRHLPRAAAAHPAGRRARAA